MSENRVLVLMAGGYPLDETLAAKGLLKHQFQDSDGKTLFQALVDNVPAKRVWIVHNLIFQGFWNKWWSETIQKEPKRSFSLFLDRQNSLGKVSNPSLWITSGSASLAMNFEIPEVIFAPIDIQFLDFRWMDDFIKERNAIVVTPIDEEPQNPARRVDLDFLGNIRSFGTEKGEWEFVDMFKTTTNDLLANGQLNKGSFTDVVKRMMARGVVFKAIKAQAQDMTVTLNNPPNEAISNGK